MSADAFRAMPPSTTNWYEIDQARIDRFADVTEDWQFIHLDLEQARAAGLPGTVAHGFLTLSMLSAMSYEVTPDLPDMEMGLNYGFDRIRFVAPVLAGQRIRGHFEVTEVVEKGTRIDLRWQVTVEIDGQDKPALVADWLNVFQMKEA